MSAEERAGDPELPRPGAPLVQRLPIPWVCYVVLAGSVGMFLLERVFPLDQIFVIEDTRFRVQRGALFLPAVRAGEWWRVLTMVFEHGGPLHLFFNMTVVWTLGRTMERAIRTWRFALISVGTALGASAFVLLFSNPLIPTVGASGMILGWAGAMLPIATRQGRESLLTWLIQVAIISLLPGVSWAGHLGGFLVGLPFGAALRGGTGGFKLVAPVLVLLAAALTFVAAFGLPLR